MYVKFMIAIQKSVESFTVNVIYFSCVNRWIHAIKDPVLLRLLWAQVPTEMKKEPLNFTENIELLQHVGSSE